MEKNHSLPKEEFLASINILEQDIPSGTFMPVPIKEEGTKRSSSYNVGSETQPKSVFLLRIDHQRKIVLKLFQVTAEKCVSAYLGKVHLIRTSFKKALTHTLSTPSMAPGSQQHHTRTRSTTVGSGTPPVPKEEKRELSLVIEPESTSDTIVMTWQGADPTFPLLNEKTLKGYSVSATLEFNLMLKNIEKPIRIEIPISVKVLEPQIDFKVSP